MGSVGLQSLTCRAGTYMTFTVGEKYYSLPADTVRQVIPLDKTLSGATIPTSNRPHRVVDFDGTLVVVYRFSHLVGGSSRLDENLFQINMLQQHYQEHVDWLSALETSLNTGESFTETPDPHRCSLGAWIAQHCVEDVMLRGILELLDAPHRRLHSLAQRLLSLAHDQHRQQDALEILKEERTTTLRTLGAHISQAQSRLRDMVSPVAVVIDASDRLFALEMDEAGDAQEFSNEDWFSPDLIENKAQKDERLCVQTNDFYDGFFQKSDGPSYIRIDPASLLHLST